MRVRYIVEDAPYRVGQEIDLELASALRKKREGIVDFLEPLPDEGGATKAAGASPTKAPALPSKDKMQRKGHTKAAANAAG